MTYHMDLLIQELEWGKNDNMKNDDFDLKNLPVECQDESISKDDFKLIDSKERVHEQKFETKPTTFFKDSLKRFSKNKSSVVGGIIVGLLLVLSVIVPAVVKYDIKHPHPYETFLQPKLFDAGTGFWDGTKKYTNIAVDTGVNGFKETDRDANWWPSSQQYPQRSAILKKTFTDISYTNAHTEFGREGYIQFGVDKSTIKDDYIELETNPIAIKDKNTYKKDLVIEPTDTILLTKFDTYDIAKIKELEGDRSEFSLQEGFTIVPVSLYFNYSNGSTTESIELLSGNDHKLYSIGSEVTSRSEEAVDLTAIIRSHTSDTTFKDASFSLRMANNKTKECALIRSFVLDANLTNKDYEEAVELVNFDDATVAFNQPFSDPKVKSLYNRSYWACNGYRGIFLSKVVYCSFLLDTYEQAYGETVTTKLISDTHCKDYDKRGLIKWNIKKIFDSETATYSLDETKTYYEVLDKENSPIKEFITVDVNPDDGTLFIEARICMWQFLEYPQMPRHLFGTDDAGRDMLKYVFDGLKYSLLLGIMTFVICFLFGLLWGSVSGYFGGAVDLVMERFTDILAGVPWIVVMTLVIIRAQKSTFGVFLLALCLTGWIGTASTTRTQFYRFRGREYVLASRTLGASDARLIAKHILPNAMGTIITGAVLMIPSVIFSEATISYLGLGFRSLSSLGVTLSHEQNFLDTYPYLLLFPSVIIALLMISFNLFGNGLRDAVNPSLKGEGE